jgi:nucleotide-binding universal stress UspA family protein
MGKLTETYDKILVPVDGSDLAERAFDKGVQAAIENHGH